MPAAVDNALINTASPNPAVIGTGVNAVAAQVRLGTASGGSATISIANGGRLTNTQGLIGFVAGSTGTATVAGSGSGWTNTSSLTIGAAGTGSLTVSSGGTVNAVASNVGTSTLGNPAIKGTLRIESGGAFSGSSLSVGQAAGSYGEVVVTGANSTLTSTTNQFIGSAGTGSLQILSGATATGSSTRLGNSAGSLGTALVDGSGSRWTSTSSMYVGNLGNGTLKVSGQGGVVTKDSYLAFASGTTGSVSVTGAGSTWVGTGNLFSGQSGNGAFTVSDGASASAVTVYSGYNSGSSGSLTITGAGSFTSTNLNVGHLAGATGAVTVAGAGSSLTSGGTQFIGVSGTGSLRVLDGGTYTGNSTFIGQGVDSIGTALVSGAGSTWTSNAGITVGRNGAGTLSVENGGNVFTSNTSLSNAAAATGSVTVTGAGSRWTGTGYVNIGSVGSGTFTISNGGAVSAASSSLGLNAGSAGHAAVTGAGSSLSLGSLYVGNYGEGTLTVSDKGSVETANSYVGNQAGSTGSVVVAGVGSSWTATSNQFIGTTGTGSLQILDGATVTGATTRLGHYAGGVGTALVSGAGSRWTSTSSMNVGLFGFGRGTLTVADQGEVVTKDASMANYADAIGVVMVTGAGSKWTTTGNMSVGLQGEGAFTVADGATANVFAGYVGDWAGSNGNLRIESGGHFAGTALTVGDEAGSTGAAMVTGPGSLLSSSENITIGNSGTGQVTLSSLGEIHAAGIKIAEMAGSSGTLNIGAAAGAAPSEAGTLNAGSISFGSGAGTLLLNHADNAYRLSAVITGSGDIDAESGRTLLLSDSWGFSGSTAIGSSAILQIGDGGVSGGLGGSVMNNGNLTFDRSDDSIFAGPMSGTGSLTKAGGGTLALTGNSSGFTGATTLAAGALAVSGHLGGSLIARAGTVLSGSGSVGSVTAESGSTIAPGTAPGDAATELSVTGTYHQLPGSTYRADLLPQSLQSDRIAVAGSAMLGSGAILHVTNAGAQIYGINDVYPVLTAAGGVSGSYLLTGDTVLSALYELQAVYETNAVLLKVVQIREFSDAALTDNQTGAADGLSSLPAGNALRDVVASQDSDAAVRKALDLMSGEIHASAAGAILGDGRLLRDAVLGRLRCVARDAGASQSESCLERAVWIEGHGAQGENEGDGDASAIATGFEGFTIGADVALSRDARIGIFGGHGRSDVTAAESRSRASVESHDLGVYGGASWNGFAIGLGAAYGWNNIVSSRQLSFPGLTEDLQSDYQARMVQIFGEVGYSFAAGPADFEPFARLAYANLQTSSFSESGGSAALSSEAQGNSLTLSTLGLRGSGTARLFDMDLKADAMAGWQHGWGDLTPGMHFSFAGGGSFRITGVPAATDAAVVEAGLTAIVTGEGSFGIWYTGLFSSDTRSQGLRASLNFSF